MRVKQAAKAVLPLLCALTFAVSYYCLKARNPHGTNHGDPWDLITWLRSVDSIQVAGVVSGDTNKSKQYDYVSSPRYSVKMLTSWVEQIIADEGENSADGNGATREASDIDAETLRLLKEAAQKKLPDGSPVTAVLVLACDRVSVARCLHQLITYRPSKTQFPIIVSRDCNHKNTAKVISFFNGRGAFSVRQPDQSPIAVPRDEEHRQRYYSVARHYRWLLNLTFETVGFDSAIIVEDYLDIAPDFFEYFAATRELLERDPSLWCVSAWNDNGKEDLVDLRAGDLVHRTDFFPGLGWMLRRSEWTRLAPGWPRAYWDDWLRRPEQRLGRACLRPEISRTRTFGSQGVSEGVYYNQHIGRVPVVLSSRFVDFTELILDHLLKDNYDLLFNATLRGSRLVTVDHLLSRNVPETGPVRITYDSYQDFKLAARSFHLMDDVRSGVPRTAYYGVVTFVYKGVRAYLAPRYGWKGYNENWK